MCDAKNVNCFAVIVIYAIFVSSKPWNTMGLTKIDTDICSIV